MRGSDPPPVWQRCKDAGIVLELFRDTPHPSIIRFKNVLGQTATFMKTVLPARCFQHQELF